MTYIPVATATVSTVNSTSAALGAGATFTGTPEDVSQFASLSVSYYIQPYTATGNIFVQFSNTASPFYPVSNTVTTVTGLTANGFTLDTTMTCQYFRVSYINDSTPQTTLMIQSIYHPQARVATTTTRYAEIPNDYTDLLNTRSLIWGKTAGGNVYEPIFANGENSLITAVVDPRTSYGDMQVAVIDPVAQIDFSYGINSVSAVRLTAGSNASVMASNSLATLTANAAVGASLAYLSPKKFVKYRAGQGTMGRITGIFTSGAPTNSIQFVGQGFLDPSSNAFIDGQGFGYQGSTFGLFWINNTVSTFVPQTQWNVDNMLGGTKSGKVMDPTKLNIFEFKFQYLGGGNLFYYVFNDYDGRKVLVHMIQNAGKLTGTIFQSPSMRMMWYSNNYATGTTTAPVVVKGGSCGHFIEGARKYNGPKGGVVNYYQSLDSDGQFYSILAIRNALYYNGIANRSQLHFRNVSVSCSGGGANTALINIRKNPTATYASWTPYSGTGTDGITITNGNSTAFSNAATGITVTGGNNIFTAALSNGPSQMIYDLTDYDIVAYPGDLVVLCIAVNGGGTDGNFGASMTWSEDI
jgi:hypothetical protein